MLKSKHIVLGITGSIAAYKACILARLLVKAGAEVQIIITPAGKEFITPLTLSTLTSRPVISEFFSRRDGSWNSHVELGLWADAMVIAPATASTIAKMANGIADNMLLTTYLSMKAPVLVAPAMDLDMYSHPATRRNLQTLANNGNYIIEPTEGELASHLVGKGRMEEPERIMAAIKTCLDSAPISEKVLSGKRILITAGPTQERIDAVRYISNYSSGKMGFALAQSCAAAGAEVELIAGPVSLPTSHPRIHRTDVVSAEDMYDATTRLFPRTDAAILCAAVADFSPARFCESKIKREETGDFCLPLKPTHDIAAALGKLKTARQRLIGFALETDHELENAQSKLERKNLDCIVLNSLRDKGAGFGHDTNKVCLLSRDGTKESLPLLPKAEVADRIVQKLAGMLAS